MNTNISTSRRKWLWLVIASTVLLIWTVYCKATWPHDPHIPTVLAFFLGVLALVILNFIVRVGAGTWRNGWRWLVSRDVWGMLGWTLVFAVSVVALFYALELWRGKRAWAHVVRESKARGEILEYEVMFGQQPPDEQNFAKAPLFAPFFKPYDPLTERYPRIPDLEIFSHWSDQVPLFAPWREAQKSELRKVSAYYFKTNLLTDLTVSTGAWKSAGDEQLAGAMLIAMEKYRTMLDEARQFSDRPNCWFPRGQWLLDLLGSPSSEAMRSLLRLVRLRASAELAAKQPEAAFNDLKLALRLADLGRQCPMPNSRVQTKYHEFVMDALQPLWEGLADHYWTDGRIAEIQNELGKLDLLGDYANSVRADALSTAMLCERMIPTTNSKLPREQELFYREQQQRILHFVRLIYPRGWSLQDQAALHRFHLEFTSRYLDLAARRIAEKRPGNLSSAVLFSSSDPCFYIFIVPKVKEYASEASEGFPFMQTAVDQATLACALERYRLAHGEFPATLDALVPKFIAKLPHDIVNGEPLKYRRTDGGGFVLYSVGLNEVDDGGKPCGRYDYRSDFRIRDNDWVWACPASVASK